MRIWLGIIPLLAATMIANTAFAGARAIHEKRRLKANGSLSVTNVAGSVKIIGTDEEMMELSGTVGDGVDEVEISGEGDSVRIRVELIGRGKSDGDAKLEIRIPRSARIDVDCVSADVDVRDTTGAAIVNTVSGDLQISGELRTIELKTVSGDIHIEAVGERLIAQSVSGDITITRAIGEVELETVSGDVKIEAGRISRFRAKSVSGNITLIGDITGKGASDLESHSGDITLDLGDHTDASFEAHTFSGRVHGRGDRNGSRFVIGSGAGRVSIHTFSGDIRVRTP